MQSFGYSPFAGEKDTVKTIYEITLADLDQLKEREIEEGVQIEYKRELSDLVKKKIPKIITSFANERGGWLFIGIDEVDKTIRPMEKKDYELTINNILKTSTSPTPRIIARFLSLPEDDLHGVLVIWVPEGDKPPYIANGRVYRRVGSGSSPLLKEVDDRYYLDKLYQKSETRLERLKKFCTKELSIYNRQFNQFTGKYSYSGMCNVYLIPIYRLNLLQEKEPEQLAEYLLEQSKITRSYSVEGVSVSLNIPFFKPSFSPGSIILRNTDVLDFYENTLAWEQYFDGAAKFHLPIPYMPDKQKIINFLREIVTSYHDPEVFNDFNYVNGNKFLFILLGCIGSYFNAIKQLQTGFDEVMVYIELNDIRKDVLYFETEQFCKLLREIGIVFSDKNDYRLNEHFVPSKVETSNFVSLLSYLMYVVNAFGLSAYLGVKNLIAAALKKQNATWYE